MYIYIYIYMYIEIDTVLDSRYWMWIFDIDRGIRYMRYVINCEMVLYI